MHIIFISLSLLPFLLLIACRYVLCFQYLVASRLIYIECGIIRSDADWK